MTLYTFLNWDGSWRGEELFEDIMAKTFPNLISNINSHIKEAQ